MNTELNDFNNGEDDVIDDLIVDDYMDNILNDSISDNFFNSEGVDYSLNEYCHQECEFYKFCYANHELCIKQTFEDILHTLTPREEYIVKKYMVGTIIPKVQLKIWLKNLISHGNV